MDISSITGTLLPTILSAIIGLLVSLFGFIVKNNGEIKTLKSEKASKKEVEELISEKMKVQYERIDEKIGFISKCIIAIAKQLNINTPLE